MNRFQFDTRQAGERARFFSGSWQISPLVDNAPKRVTTVELPHRYWSRRPGLADPPNVSLVQHVSLAGPEHWSDFKRVMVPAIKKPARGVDCEFPAP
jgi:hypothetical protein